jgi:hypothetical protein
MIHVSSPPHLWWRIGLPLSHRPANTAPQPALMHRFTMRLGGGASEVVDRPDRGVSVRCQCGRLWITHDGDPKDVVLDAGQVYTAERCERMTLHAVQDSEMELQFRRIR